MDKEEYSMQFRFIIWSFLILIGWLMTAGAQEVQNDLEKGKEIYHSHCMRCHGIQGKGDGPDADQFTVPPTNFHRLESRSKSEKELRSAIIWGLAFSPMHQWSDKLSVEEMRAVAAYIRQLAPYRPTAP